MNHEVLIQAFETLKRKRPDEDALQEAVVATIPRLGRIRNVKAYLARSAWRKRRTSRVLDDGRERQSEFPTPEFELSRAESIREVRTAIANLPARERVVVELHDLLGATCDTIARDRGWTNSATRALLYRAHARLARSLRHLIFNERDEYKGHDTAVVGGRR